MTLWFRFLWLLLRLPFRGRLGLRGVSCLRVRCWPSDCDINIHMNNAKYLALMDLGRLDMLYRTGLVSYLWREKAAAVLGKAEVEWRRPVAPFQSFTLETRVVDWDDKWIRLEQTFLAGDGTLLAVGRVSGAFLVKGRRIEPANVLAHLPNAA